jgi:similar to stage IV sporulation protein
MLDNIRGITEFRADGGKTYSFINALRNEKIICHKQRCINNSFYGEIYSDRFPFLCSIAKKYGVTVTVEKRYGMRYKFLKYKKRFGIIAGLVLVPLFIMFISDTVVIIEINGNEKNSDRQILSALEDIGIKKGTSVSDIDFSYAEQHLRLSLDNVVWTAIRHTGCRIVVDIDESEKEPELLKERMTGNIVASHDAQIVSVNVLSGQLVKIINDGVKKGDIIISGIYSDKKGQIRNVHALGNIIGIYNDSVIFSQNYDDIQHNPTGNITEQKYFEAFGFRIPLFIKKDLPESFEYAETITPFMFMDNELPFAVVKSRYAEYKDYNVTYDAEQAEKILMEKVKRYENNFFKDIEIIERDIQKNQSDDKIEYIVNYTLKGEIGINEDIFIKSNNQNNSPAETKITSENNE